MTVYVDDMYQYPMGQFRRMKMSHMIANTDEELHIFAQRLGLQFSWFQGDHYDISMSVRTKAIKLGAVPITLKQLAAMSRLMRFGWRDATPDHAIALAYHCRIR